MAFTAAIDAEAEAIWERILDHPMVRELGAGTLDDGPFRYWVRQDYVFLIEYSRLFALGAAKAPSVDRMETFAELLHSTLSTEMDLHRSYAGRFDLSAGDLAATTPSPTTRAYTDFLVRTAALGSFGETVAALLPCMWGFNETGTRLADAGVPDDERAVEWIEMYAGAEFTELTDWCKGLMDDVAAEATAAERERYRDLFVTSARYEYRFWDAAWREEGWGA